MAVVLLLSGLRNLLACSCACATFATHDAVAFPGIAQHRSWQRPNNAPGAAALPLLLGSGNRKACRCTVLSH